MIVDASVAAKWVLPEPDSDRASRLRQEGQELIAPTLVAAEIGNAIWKRTLQNEVTPDEATVALRVALSLFTRFAPLPALSKNAIALSIELRHPIYDCFYIALAQRERTELITADERMAAAAKRAKIKVRTL